MLKSKYNYYTGGWDFFVRDNYIPLDKNDDLRICFVTLETRTNLNYVKLHDECFKQYSEKYGCTYVSLNKCNSSPEHIHNPYWCKVYIVYELLLSGKYDYVFWIDSDAIIKNFNFDIRAYLRTNYKYSIITTYDLWGLNAGVFGGKSDEKGLQFFKEWTEYYETKNFKQKCQRNQVSGKLNGRWAGVCYEQGWLNSNVLSEKYVDNFLVMPKNIVYNGSVCKFADGVFIVHLTSSSDKIRMKCYTKK